MILYEITNSEIHPLYQALEITNGNRQYDFLRSIVYISLGTGRTFLSENIIKALNFHAITCLHTNAGEYRPCSVSVGNYIPPDDYRVPALMADFVNLVNHTWKEADPIWLSAHILWRMNHIHPFINGNGRTARAASYFALCIKAGGWLPGNPILPELIRQNRPEYVAALKHADAAVTSGNSEPDLAPLHAMLARLLSEQLASVQAHPNPD